MLRLLDHPADAAVLAPLVEREILWRLLTGPFGDVIRQIGLPDSNLSHVNRAIGWIRDNYAERVRISDLARLSRISPSAFHRNFRAVTPPGQDAARLDRKSTRLNSSHVEISYAVFCLKKKKKPTRITLLSKT